ncbi:hypothetical protein [Marinoscillum sp. MHG1-6]|uniref:hypothetical protein n=1 Tax=Marinoscillum sp. MHG1-6 TaxID=2959627 RepID=UPI00215851B8|nr:hypothetical protein [Marinoscillum sp. MHG1-6]
MRSIFCVAVLAALTLVSCGEELDDYSIDAPADLQQRIDSIAAAKSASGGDTTFIDITTKVVGAEDNSSAWWSAHSDYFKVPANKRLVLEFVNHGKAEAVWNNWVLATASDPFGAEDYFEYFILRSDGAGWSFGHDGFDPNLVVTDRPADDAEFISVMQGASVTLVVDHSPTGNLFVTSKSVGTDGTEIVMTYNQPIGSVEDITAFLVVDGSHFEMEEAYLLPSAVTVLEDYAPISIAVNGAPASVELGNENFWGNAVATVTFEDGSSEEVDSVDLTFSVIPDMTTIGNKTVVVAYSKSKLGEYSQAATGYYKLDVTNSIVSIAANNIDYYYFGTDDVAFKPKGFVVTATYSDNSTSVLDNADVDFVYPGTVSPSVGTQTVDISYVGSSTTFNTTSTVTFVEGTSQVGASNLSTSWWGAHSADFTVASGMSKTFQLYCYSTDANNWNAPATILRRVSDAAQEFGVVRIDNFGWGSGYGAATTSHDWDFGTLASNISGSYIEITVTNNGDDTADIRYDVTHANGETHFQQYTGITVDSADLSCALTVDNCYLVLVN